jgi:type II secretory ATPase GspE/PulE/Tfp pilus assembly ATPase PilB-like protein
MILQRRSSAELKQFAQKSMITMAQDAFQKASAGETTLEEIVRVTAGDQLE